MALDPVATEVGDINLDNYYLDHQFYNTYVYVHKKFLPKSELHKKSTHDDETHIGKVKQNMREKNQQHYIEKAVQNTLIENKKVKNSLHDDAIVEQTVKFTKDLIPKVIPPSREISPTPVFYTIKTSKFSGKKISKFSDTHIEDNSKPGKEKTECVAKKIKKDKAYIHTQRNVSHSSQDNTLDDYQTNSTFSFTEVYENNLNKKTYNQRKRKYEAKSKLILSESPEGIATGINTSNHEIKIYLMNESEKNNFIESLRVPIINTVKEYLKEIKNPSDISVDFQILAETLTSNMQKLDYVIQTIDKIEKKIVDYSDKTTKIIMSPKPISSKGSRLEELAEDLPEIKEVNSTDEYESNVSRRAMATRSAIVTMNQNHDNVYKPNRIRLNLDDGEDVPIHSNGTCGQLGVKVDRPNRVPARFCWTDTNKEN